jgi:hypothetical protein
MIGGYALAAVALAGGAPPAAWAASLRDRLGATTDDRFVVPIVGRFRSETGETFVIDRADDRATLLIRFENTPEIWVLKPHLVTRGDVIYRNDVGDPVLRATRVGGLTLFPRSNPGGVAAAFAGAAPGLHPPPVSSPSALLQSFTQASARAGRAAQQQVVSFEARNVPLPAVPLFADAAQVAAEAFVQVAVRQGGLGRWTKVEFEIGRSPGVSAANGTLHITLTPERGLAGRPSSLRIAEVIAKAGPAPRREERDGVRRVGRPR